MDTGWCDLFESSKVKHEMCRIRISRRGDFSRILEQSEARISHIIDLHMVPTHSEMTG